MPPAPFFQNTPDETAGLALFLNAGDPPLDELVDVVHMFDENKVDCLELAVPFPNSVTDGPTIKESAKRALADGVTYEQTLEFVAAIRPKLEHMRIALLVDWTHSVKHRTFDDVFSEAVDAKADGVLVHATPARLRPELRRVAANAAMPLVTTCFATSDDAVMADAVAHATAYLYLVSTYGKTGGKGLDTEAVRAAIARVRAVDEDCPVAVGFGVRSARDVDALHSLGAEAAIVGSAVVAEVERARIEGRSVLTALEHYVQALRPSLALSATGLTGD